LKKIGRPSDHPEIFFGPLPAFTGLPITGEQEIISRVEEEAGHGSRGSYQKDSGKGTTVTERQGL
jgi:hypothetical protein